MTQMTLLTAIQTCFAKSIVFYGRASRSEYWYFVLFSFCGQFLCSLPDVVIGMPVIQSIFQLIILLPGVSVSVRRLHDVGRSGWWLLLTLTFIGAFVLLYWMCQKSSPEENPYAGPLPGTPESV